MKGCKPRLRLVEDGAVPPRCPGAPAWLSAAAKREWRRIAPVLQNRRLLDADTLATIESYCVAVGTVRETEEILIRDGRVIETDGGPVVHPATRLQVTAMREARLLAAELGVTPYRRKAAPAAPGPVAVDDPWG